MPIIRLPALRTNRLALLGLALGLFLPVSRATSLGLTGRAGGDLLFELALLGLLTGLVGLPLLPRPWRSRMLPLGILLPVIPALAVFLAGFALPDLWHRLLALLATSATFLFLHLLGRAGSELLEERETDTASRLATTMLAGGLGCALAALLLPLLGISLLIAAVLALLAWGGAIRSPGRRVTLGAALIMLAALALLDLPAMQTRVVSLVGRGVPVARRTWYADGPAVMRHQGRRWTQTTLSSGRIEWYTPRRHRTGKRRLGLAASTAMAGTLARNGSVLLLGPATGASWLRIPSAAKTEVLHLGDRRLTWWYRYSLPSGGPRTREAVPEVSGSLRSFLAARRGRFDLVYYVDPYDLAALAAGTIGRRPAYHLTVESLKAYLDALNEDGFLVMEIPYSLKVVTTLREIARRDGFPLAGNLLVASDAETGRDIVVFRKSPLEPRQVDQLAEVITRRGGFIHYRPGDRLMTNAVVRLVWAQHPRWYYASGTDEFSPPTDDRPFFYQGQKLIPRTRREEVIGLTPLQTGRFLGLLPLGDLPWVVFSGVGILAGLILFLRRSPHRGDGGAPMEDWRYRFFVFFVLFGIALELSLLGGFMVLNREFLPDYLSLPLGMSFSLVGLAAGLTTMGRRDRRRVTEPWVSWLLLPAALLPLLAGLFNAAPDGAPMGATILVLCLIPFPALAGRILGTGLAGSMSHGAFPPGACLGFIGLGALIGREAAIPFAQTFGLAFTIVLGWVTLFVALRMHRRIPPAAPGR